MGVENILIVVYIWHNRMPGSNSSEVFRNVLDRAKDLLTTLHSKVMEAEVMLQKRIEEQQMLALPPSSSSPKRERGKNNLYIERQKREYFYTKLTEHGNDLVTKVYPSDVIPDKYIERKRDYRPNNFLGALPTTH